MKGVWGALRLKMLSVCLLLQSIADEMQPRANGGKKISDPSWHSVSACLWRANGGQTRGSITLLRTKIFISHTQIQTWSGLNLLWISQQLCCSHCCPLGADKLTLPPCHQTRWLHSSVLMGCRRWSPFLQLSRSPITASWFKLLICLILVFCLPWKSFGLRLPV